MIIGFADKDTRKVFQDEKDHSLPPEIHLRARDKLFQLHSARELKDLKNPPSNRLEPLLGKLNGYHSIRINAKWRIIFQWKEGDVDKVKICNYH